MKYIREIWRHTFWSIIRVVGDFNGRVKMLEDIITFQRQRIAILETRESPSIQAMEQRQHKTVEHEDARRRALCDRELRLDLVKQYGTTRWATRLINNLLNKRTREVLDISFPIAG